MKKWMGFALPLFLIFVIGAFWIFDGQNKKLDGLWEDETGQYRLIIEDGQVIEQVGFVSLASKEQTPSSYHSTHVYRLDPSNHQWEYVGLTDSYKETFEKIFKKWTQKDYQADVAKRRELETVRYQVKGDQLEVQYDEEKVNAYFSGRIIEYPQERAFLTANTDEEKEKGNYLLDRFKRVFHRIPS